MFTARYGLGVYIYIFSPAFPPHTVFMRFVWISEQTAIISLYSTNRLVFVTETENVYCAVRTGCVCVCVCVYIYIYIFSSVPPTHCIYAFCVDLRTNRDYFPILH